MMQRNKIYIVGGGVSGLTAALYLQQEGYETVIIEASDRLGGRLKTDWYNGYPMDHGFQVLLTNYPAVRKYLDLSALNLKSFQPGAVIFNKASLSLFGDPSRSFVFFKSLFNRNVANIGDLLKIFRLKYALKRQSVAELFSKPEMSTFDYLKAKGFSEKIINSFFRPFYSGIFLEKELSTSSRMFEFVFKMFSEGSAAIPEKGMEAIPKQLFDKLNKTQVLLNTKVKSVENGFIELESEEKIYANGVIVATDLPVVVNNEEQPLTQWNSCSNLYFEIDFPLIQDRIIALSSDADSLINNLVQLRPVGKKSVTERLLSVTVVGKQNLDSADLVTQIEKELKLYFDLKELRYVKRYDIKNALPVKSNLEYLSPSAEITVNNGVYLAGDVYANPSLNAAMLSGEKAAKLLVENFRK